MVLKLVLICLKLICLELFFIVESQWKNQRMSVHWSGTRQLLSFVLLLELVSSSFIFNNAFKYVLHEYKTWMFEAITII